MFVYLLAIVIKITQNFACCVRLFTLFFGFGWNFGMCINVFRINSC